jgi:hypothetical protein
MGQNRKPPAYMYYASDVMANMHYRFMSLAERGLYISLTNECWVNYCVPADISLLAKYLGFPVEVIEIALTPNVLKFFEKKNDQLFCVEIENYRAHLNEKKEILSKSGKKGAKKRWNQEVTNNSHPISLPNRVAMASEMKRNEMSRDGLDGKEIKKQSIEIGNDSNDEWVKNYRKHEQTFKQS